MSITDTNTNTGTDSGATTPPPPDTGPCDPGEAVPGTDTALRLVIDGVPRRALLRLPLDYDCTPRPVLIGLHGYYGSGEGFSHSTADLQDHLDTHGYIGLFPDGLSLSQDQSFVTSFNDLGSHFDDGPDGPTCQEGAYDYGTYDNCPSAKADLACHWGTSCADDVGFFREPLALAGASWTLDADRIYMTGFSQGGQTVQGLACSLSDVLAAIAPVHGFAANGYTCAPSTPLPMIQVWGTKDRIVPGDDGLANDGMIYDDAAETAVDWAQAQGCASETTPYPTVSDGLKG